MLNEIRINKLNKILLVIFFSVQPVLQLLLDLFGDKAFSVFGISIATIIRYCLFGTISVLVVTANIKNKATKFFIGYILVCAIYILLQYFNTRNFDSTAYYGNSGQSFFSCIMENSKYILPISLIFFVCILKPSHKQIKIAVFLAVTFIVLHLIITNLCGIDYISYRYGGTDNPAGSIIAWFSNTICATNWELFTSRGLYSSGNALSGFFSLLLPIVFFIALKSGKIWWYLLVLFQMIGMLMVGTRVSVYGAILIFVIVICIWLFDLIFNRRKVSFKRITAVLSVAVIFATFFIYSPFIARLNSDNDKKPEYIDVESVLSGLEDSSNTTSDVQSGNITNSVTESVAFESEDSVSSVMSQRPESASSEISSPDIDPEQNQSNEKYSTEFKQEFILNNYAKNSIQSSYIYNVYDYKEHTDFWFELMTEVEFSKRNDSRKIKGLILNDITETKGGVMDRIVGIGRIGIYPEADFSAIYYYNGVLGWALFVLPYIAVLLWSIIKCLMLLYKRTFSSFNYILVLSLGFIMISALLAGHILSLAHINSFIGMICGILIINLTKCDEKSKECLDD